MPEKMCATCGRTIQIDDWYAFIRTKYCKRCAAEMLRIQKANWAREFRRKNREKNAAIKELCKARGEEIAALKNLIIRQREEISALEEETSKL